MQHNECKHQVYYNGWEPAVLAEKAKTLVWPKEKDFAPEEKNANPSVSGQIAEFCVGNR